jgi:predicted nucleic acid-binding protein
MTTAVDTSVLITITKGEAGASQWIDLLAAARAEGELVICDVVAAELFALLMDEEKFRQTVDGLGVIYHPTVLDAAKRAGRIFKQCRREGGQREYLVPDFLIGAHAEKQADRIAAIDHGYLRRHFPRLKILRPV